MKRYPIVAAQSESRLQSRGGGTWTDQVIRHFKRSQQFQIHDLGKIGNPEAQFSSSRNFVDFSRENEFYRASYGPPVSAAKDLAPFELERHAGIQATPPSLSQVSAFVSSNRQLSPFFSRTGSSFVKGNLSKIILRACDSFR